MKVKLIFIDQLLCARHHSKYFTHGSPYNPFNPDNKPKEKVLSSPFSEVNAPALALPLSLGKLTCSQLLWDPGDNTCRMSRLAFLSHLP